MMMQPRYVCPIGSPMRTHIHTHEEGGYLEIKLKHRTGSRVRRRRVGVFFFLLSDPNGKCEIRTKSARRILTREGESLRAGDKLQVLIHFT